MAGVEFEPTIPAFERAKTVHALEGAAAVIVFAVPTQLKSSMYTDSFTHEVLQL
jgi:hypothetical protein